MTDETRLESALAAMNAAPDDEQPRLAFYHTFAASELFLLLEAEAEADKVTPRTVAVDGQSHVLVFDSEDRLAHFAGGEAPYVALSGRTVATMLAGQGLGVGLNLGVASTQTLLPAEAVSWLANMLSHRPAEVEARLREVRPPGELPARLLSALDARLASAAGLAGHAYLAGAVYDTGAGGHILGIIDAVPGAEEAIAAAISEVLQFSGLEAAALDVAFFRAEDPATARLARVGLRFDLPEPEGAIQAPALTPGSDPDRPPRLK
ncbi:SseB family protein [Roseovarius salis]|uniref:SseB family protein n=1 Tax=Roseovarius salis TaxID=3376063 RepID=UPI0037C9C096